MEVDEDEWIHRQAPVIKNAVKGNFIREKKEETISYQNQRKINKETSTLHHIY